jgi:hypothetical protein
LLSHGAQQAVATAVDTTQLDYSVGAYANAHITHLCALFCCLHVRACLLVAHCNVTTYSGAVRKQAFKTTNMTTASATPNAMYSVYNYTESVTEAHEHCVCGAQVQHQN